MSKYSKHFHTKSTPQNEAIPGRDDMVENNAGGFTFEVSGMERLDRFLILGSEGGTYYVGERELTIANAQNVVNLIKSDGPAVVARIVELIEANRAPRKDAAIFVLAICATLGDDATRKAAFDNLDKVCTIPTDLFNFASNIEALGGWGRGKRNAVARWYNERDLDRLAYQVVKYRQRNGWTHRDLLRLAHPSTAEEARNALYRWIVKDGEVSNGQLAMLPEIVPAFLAAQATTDARKLVPLIKKHRLTHEMLPTEALAKPAIWKALLERMPMGAMIRNLGRMTANGTLTPMSAEVDNIVERLTDADVLRKAKIHPIKVLAALKTYTNGSGFRGKMSWEPIGAISDALDEAFYASFNFVEPTGKNFYLGLDASGSMGMHNCAGMEQLTCAEGAAVMAMVSARIEKKNVVKAFSTHMIPVDITPRLRLDTVMRRIAEVNWGGTDCAQPMIDALQKKIPVDTFCVYTDNETWAGRKHPVQALNEYRQKMDRPAKLVVIGMVGNEFSIADPKDGGMLDVVGFDTATPELIADFSR